MSIIMRLGFIEMREVFGYFVYKWRTVIFERRYDEFGGIVGFRRF